MRYIDAGYAAGLAVVAGYATLVWQRRRRLERDVSRLVGRTRRP